MNAFARLRFRAIPVLLTVASLTHVAVAQETELAVTEKRSEPWEKGAISFGGYVAVFDSEIWLGSRGGGLSIDAENAFNLDSSMVVLRGEALYRPGESRRHELEFSYAGFHRNGTATLQRDITIDGVTYPVGVTVDSVFNFDIFRGTYSYALLQDDRVRISLGLGIYAIPLKYNVQVRTTDGQETIEGVSATVPLPALALRGDFQLLPKLFLYSSINAMYLEISDFNGSLLEVDVGLEYRPWKHIGFGVGYSGMSVNVEGESSNSHYPGVNFVGKISVDYGGLLLYGKYMF